MEDQMSKMLVSGVMNEIAEFIGEDVETINSKTQGNLVLWTVKFFGRQRAIAGIVDMSLNPKDLKLQVASSIIIGLHPMGEAIGWFIYAQQLAKAVPKTIAEATSAMCYYMLANLAKIIKPTSLKDMFMEEIQFSRILKMAIDNHKGRNTND